ncbi:MAG: hypothetical protein ABGX83_01715 [Nitrospira sp.]|nr:hypothetical protein [Candidatus Manganitrophaceae bacterium]HIL34986.1 hypothetical protein [Candidatus Manganitrophaceae bacterium]
MDKFEVKENFPGTNDKITFTEYKFSDEERTGFLEILRNYDQDKVHNFLRHLSFICHQRISLKEHPSLQCMKDYASPMLLNFNKTISYLSNLKKGYLNEEHKIPFYFLDKVGGKDHFIPQNGSKKNHNITETWDLSGNIEKELSGLVEEIEFKLNSWTKNRGRQKADIRGFGLEISNIFYECFNEA